MENGLGYDQKGVFSDNPKQKNWTSPENFDICAFFDCYRKFEFLEEMFITRVCYHPNLRYF